MLWEIPPKGYIFSLVIGFQPVSFSKNELFKKIFKYFVKTFWISHETVPFKLDVP